MREVVARSSEVTNREVPIIDDDRRAGDAAVRVSGIRRTRMLKIRELRERYRLRLKRNEAVRLPYFLEHYRALGVGHFLKRRQFPTEVTTGKQ